MPEPPLWGAQSETLTLEASENPGSDGTDREDAAAVTEDGEPVQWVNNELHAIASTIVELQSRVEKANSRLRSVEKIETTEAEIGRLFVEAQRFTDTYLAKLEIKIHEVLGEAEAKAQQILLEATEEAHEIRRSAQEAAFASTRTVQELQTAIVGFTTVNGELLKELNTLNTMLTTGDDRDGAELEPPPHGELRAIERD